MRTKEATHPGTTVILTQKLGDGFLENLRDKWCFSVFISPAALKLFQDAVLPPAADGDYGLCFFR